LKPELVLVVARADNGVIGRAGGLPWRLARDLQRFREITLGKPVVMGRRTFESIGRPLKGRDNIVVSRDPGYSAPGCHVAASFGAAVDLARRLAGASGATEICVIGGAAIYRAALARGARVYLTEVHMAAEGDVTIAPFAAADWRETSRQHVAAESDDSADFSFVVLERRASPAA
jgi:dihydrofolate reductase